MQTGYTALIKAPTHEIYNTEIEARPQHWELRPLLGSLIKQRRRRLVMRNEFIIRDCLDLFRRANSYQNKLRLPHNSRFIVLELQIFYRDQIELKFVGPSTCRTLSDFLSRLTV